MITQRTLLLSLALLLAMATSIEMAAAFPFSKTSAVMELTPATLPSFLGTHKPAVILFYAPWCGHCKSFHAEYERFAESVKGTVSVGAINADEHSSVGQQYGVKGFPTIKYWKMGKKTGVEDYNGQRTAAALQATLMASVTADKVQQSIRSAAELKAVVAKSPSKRAAVLFSNKKKVPAMFSIMAASPRLKELPFVFVSSDSGSASSSVASAFGISTFPSVVLLQSSGEDGDSNDGGMTAVPYKGDIVYGPLAKFFLSCLTDGCDAGAEVHSSVNLDGQQQQQRPRMAAPTRPITFDASTLANYCSPVSSKVSGQTPWCVISLADNDRVNLNAVHRSFLQDAILFFDASEQSEEVAKSLQEEMSLSMEDVKAAAAGGTTEGEEEGLCIFVRHAKPGTVKYFAAKGVADAKQLVTLLQRLINGELKLRTIKHS